VLEVNTVLEVRGLTKSFGGNTAVNDLSFGLRRGKITALIGPNGAGKTTVFNLITGAIPADAGQVRLFGRDITGLRPDVITGLGMARSFQDVRVFPSLTVLENIMLGIQDQPGDAMRNLFAHPGQVARAERAARERAREWLRFIDMDSLGGVRAGSLGFGQQKLVALARILATDSEVLLLDEPGSGIDHAWIDQMVAVVRQVSEAGRTVCVVEHNLEVVGRLADHVCFMELGRLTAEGSFADLTSDPRLTEAYFGTV
jgi:branched-chain amino acid transport system permease protein